MLPIALIPVRAGRTAKRRLAHVLAPDARDALVRALFDHVVHVVLEAGLRAIALTPGSIDPPDGVDVWPDEGAGLNRAVTAALSRTGVPVLVLHADLPLLSTDDVDRVLATDADIVIARSDDGGTNGLLMRMLMTPAFGPDSATVHASSARNSGLRVKVVDTPGFATDVDDEVGLSACAAFSPGTRL